MYESTLLWRVNIEISGFSIVYVRAYKPSVLFFRYIFTCYAEHEKKLSKKKFFYFSSYENPSASIICEMDEVFLFGSLFCKLVEWRKKSTMQFLNIDKLK